MTGQDAAGVAQSWGKRPAFSVFVRADRRHDRGFVSLNLGLGRIKLVCHCAAQGGELRYQRPWFGEAQKG